MVKELSIWELTWTIHKPVFWAQEASLCSANRCRLTQILSTPAVCELSKLV